MSHSAALIAGGKSSRMGRDKAALLVDGQPLWRRQLAVLTATGASEVFISGQDDGPWACGVGQAPRLSIAPPVIPDEAPDCGPLGGLLAALRHCASPWLLVLAVDMPKMTPAFLRQLAEEAERSQRGIVPTLRGFPEPLAAIYPKTALPFAEAALHGGQFKLEPFIRALEAAGLVRLRRVPAEEAGLFTNWNTPGDTA